MRSEMSDENACIVSDVQFPGTSDLDLPLLPARAGRRLPVIFLMGEDIPENRNRPKRLGASAYFRNPVDDQALLDAIAWAIRGGSANRWFCAFKILAHSEGFEPTTF